MLWNREVQDVEARTQRDLAALEHDALREGARARMERRGTAALPVILRSLPSLRPRARETALEVLAGFAPRLGVLSSPPRDEVGALAWWSAFDTLRSLDFREAFALRQARRVAQGASRNASEELARLGTFAVPAIIHVLEETTDTDGARRLTELLAGLTGRALRAEPGDGADGVARVTEAWRALWVVEEGWE
jgi:hypothetical protein